MKILITGGGTIQAIDEMRTISNKSTGRTAITLAETYSKDHEVTLLLGTNIVYQNREMSVCRFTNVDSVLMSLQSLVPVKFDLIIHAAAISDYEVSVIRDGERVLNLDKIPSGLANLTMEFKPTLKVINRIKDLFPQTYLVGFKLTGELTRSEIDKNVQRVFKDAKTNLIVQNNISERKLGLDHFELYQDDLTTKKSIGLNSLAENILNSKMNNSFMESEL